MFIGSVPRQSIQQLLAVAGLSEQRRIYVCCSGQFRLESALREQMPKAWISGNDVSLLSCALGYWLSGQSLPFRFTGDLADLEDVAPGDDPRRRLAALLLALEMSGIKRTHEYGLRQWSMLWSQAGDLIHGIYNRLEKYADIRIDDFYAGDLRDQAHRALAADGVILAFTPTYKGGYERAYKSLMANVAWTAPDYRLWDNKSLPEFLHGLERERGQYFVYCDYPMEGFQPLAKFQRGHGKTVWLYGHQGQRSSLRAESLKSKPFVYEPIDVSRLSAATTVNVVKIDTQRFNFLRERYLSRGIEFSNGNCHFLVLLDGMLAGGIAYEPVAHGQLTDLYLLSDFSISQERKLSKLIALLATSRDLTRQVEQCYGQRFTHLYTTAFTDKPVSMKYRGVFEVSNRKPGMVNYVSVIRPQTLAELYAQWWSRHAKNPR
ncbi:MAG: hypothetical protein QG599_1232 [Pseudomonadota bacterium]|nr:hypothetical protein [Pseudomonadota bacterium]